MSASRAVGALESYLGELMQKIDSLGSDVDDLNDALGDVKQRLEKLEEQMAPNEANAMSDDQQHLINIRHCAAILRAGDRTNLAGGLEKAADRLEALTRPQEPPEGSVLVRVAVAIGSLGCVHAVGIHGDDTEVSAIAALRDYDITTHECIAIVPVPKRSIIPTVTAKVEEVAGE